MKRGLIWTLYSMTCSCYPTPPCPGNKYTISWSFNFVLLRQLPTTRLPKPYSEPERSQTKSSSLQDTETIAPEGNVNS
ncbi:hypothetical protein B0H63DRAFT_462423 [Podospora didyma]|uniref:Uncharacterized protein n=1 Tax=Podospora didyma TaxID=330526 RepID=A0AAE0P7R6_9PEZI|nr:hypothetical protein B0H63DRAFT_462423 [Podospora didyma]